MTPTVDVPQAADLMKVHPKTVLDHIKSGELAAARVGRAYVMMTRDVLALVERQIVRQMIYKGCEMTRHDVGVRRLVDKRDNLGEPYGR